MIRKMIKVLICYVGLSPWHIPLDIGPLCQYYQQTVRVSTFIKSSVIWITLHFLFELVRVEGEGDVTLEVLGRGAVMFQ